ncbi:hypothetical protein A7U60_g6098 [Sanghuangporus baumii]|uniref:Phytocyanin domain-containing protein n=1 Tax=Sanghuangporus baumii TaxID=108892 RepID=A0A9Q5HW24_SANBA|nr:hypothetical protein A7U60_g6098 [Sanghuangporus baumii]
MLFAALAATLLPVYAAAQNVFTVEVASSGLNFSPNNVNGVSDGDVVQFVFRATGHTVTQSTLADPCTPLDGGFNSGTSQAAGDVWNLTISDATTPIWYFCATAQPQIHCEQGMVGAINSPDDKFASYTNAAKAATNTPSVSEVVLSGSGAAATASLTTAPVVSGTSPASGSGSDSGSATGSAAATQSSSAAQPFAGFETLGATVLALFGALLF